MTTDHPPVRELAPGLWHWRAAHPEWVPGKRWQREVSSFAIDDGTSLVLVDPQTVPDRLLELAATRRPVIVLTAPWHERDTRQLVDRLGAPVWTPRPDDPEERMRKFGVTREEAGDGYADLGWMMDGEAGELHLYQAGDEVPGGATAVLGREANDLVLWVERLRAVISGDTLVDFGQGFEINRWLRDGVTRAQVVSRLEPLLDLPVRLVLSAHGDPVDRATLERALA